VSEGGRGGANGRTRTGDHVVGRRLHTAAAPLRANGSSVRPGSLMQWRMGLTRRPAAAVMANAAATVGDDGTGVAPRRRAGEQGPQ
jgi:hypothetical protein